MTLDSEVNTLSLTNMRTIQLSWIKTHPLRGFSRKQRHLLQKRFNHGSKVFSELRSIIRPNPSLLFHRWKNQDMLLSDSQKVTQLLVEKLNPRFPALAPSPLHQMLPFCALLFTAYLSFLPMCKKSYFTKVSCTVADFSNFGLYDET